MKRLVNAITCTRFVIALILALAALLVQGTAACGGPPGFPHWKSWCWCCAPGRRPPMCAACYG